MNGLPKGTAKLGLGLVFFAGFLTGAFVVVFALAVYAAGA